MQVFRARELPIETSRKNRIVRSINILTVKYLINILEVICELFFIIKLSKLFTALRICELVKQNHLKLILK